MNAAAIAAALASGCHVLLTGTFGAGKTRLLADAFRKLPWRPRELRALALSPSSAQALDQALAGRAAASTVTHAAWLATTDRAIVRTDKRPARFALARFLNDQVAQTAALVELQAGGRQAQAWRRQVRHQIVAALALQTQARLADADPLDLAADTALAPIFVERVATAYNKFLDTHYDQTTLAKTAASDASVRAVAVDDAEDLRARDLALLKRLYPAAAFLFAGNPAAALTTGALPLAELPHQHHVELAAGPPPPAPWLIETRGAAAALLPRELPGDVLIVLGRYCQLSRWIGWAMHAGRLFAVADAQPGTRELRELAAIWQADQGEDVDPRRLNRLAAALGEPLDVNICAADLPGWSNWRSMAERAGYSALAISYAAAVLARHGTLDPEELRQLPHVRLAAVEHCKGRRAGTVVIDGWSFPGEEDTRWRVAATRAARQLIVLQPETGSRRLPADLAAAAKPI